GVDPVGAAEVGPDAQGLASQGRGLSDRLLGVGLPAEVGEHDAMAAPHRLQHEGTPDPARAARDHRQRRRAADPLTNSCFGKSASSSWPVSVTRNVSLSSNPHPSIHMPSMRWKVMFGSNTVVSFCRRLAVWSAQLGG